jgi:hypothetical protein
LSRDDVVGRHVGQRAHRLVERRVHLAQPRLALRRIRQIRHRQRRLAAPHARRVLLRALIARRARRLHLLHERPSARVEREHLVERALHLVGVHALRQRGGDAVTIGTDQLDIEHRRMLSEPDFGTSEPRSKV